MKMPQISGLTKFAILVGLVFAISMFTEQGDSKDINDRFIATTIAGDIRDGEFWFYAEFANIQPGLGGGGGGSSSGAKKYIVVKGHGATIPEARDNLNRQLDKPIFLSSVRTLILTEAFAQEHLVEYLFRLRADETYRKKLFTMITRDNLEAMFKALGDLDNSLGFAAENTITTLEGLGANFTRTTSRLLENLSDTYTGILLPVIGLQDEQTALTGYAVVNDTRVIGFLPIADCRGLNMLKTDMARTIYVIPYKQDQFTVDAILMDRKVKTTYENGKPSFKFSLSFEATLEYGDKKTPYGLSEADNEALSDIVKQRIEQDVNDAIFQAQVEFKTDYLQLDDAFRVTFPEVADSMDWNVAFEQATIAAEAEVSLKSAYSLDYTTDVSR